MSMVQDKWEFLAEYPDFRKKIEEIENGQKCFTHDQDLLLATQNGFDPLQKNLKVVAIPNEPLLAPQLAAQYHVSDICIEDTMEGTGLGLVLNNETYPIGKSALIGLADRAGFTFDGINRHYSEGPDAVADALNRQFLQGKGGVSIIVNCEKVRAVNGPHFAIGKFSDILDIYEMFCQQFSGATSQKCYISHDLVKWEMNMGPQNSALLTGTSLEKEGFEPAMRFITSNTGRAAFQAVPMLKRCGTNLYIPLCAPSGILRVRHMGSEKTFAERTSGLMNRIIRTFECATTALNTQARNLEKLKGVSVDNAYNAVLRVMAEVGIPKKCGMEAAKAFGDLYPAPQKTTAYDCMLAIINAYAFYCRDNPLNERGQMNVSFCVGAAMGLNWTEYALPGDFAW